MKAWRPLAGILLVGLLLWPALPARAQAPQIWVDDNYCASCANDGHSWGTDAFDTISGAARAVAPGGTIYVRGGRYQEDVRLGRSCALQGIGPGSVTLTPRTANATITVAANDVTIEGLDIAGSKLAAILVLGPRFQYEPIHGVTVRGNVIQGRFFGVAVNVDGEAGLGALPVVPPVLANGLFTPLIYGLQPATEVEISNNTVSGCKRAIYTYNTTAEIAGNSISDLEADGIGIYSSQGSVSHIRSNTVTAQSLNAHAVQIMDNQGTIVEGNTLIGSTDYMTPTTALALYGYADLLVSKNTLHGFYSGVMAYTGGSARIAGNTFDGTLGSSLSVSTAVTETTVTVEGNTFRGSYLGLRLDDGGGYALEASVQGNAFNDNVLGIQVAASLDEDRVGIHGNSICGNLVAGLRSESSRAVDASDNWWGANDGPKPRGSGDSVEGLVSPLIEPWLRLQASTSAQPDGQVTITASLANGSYRLPGLSLTFTTGQGAFVETNSATRTALTDFRGEAQATLFPLQNSTAMVTIGGSCGRPITLAISAPVVSAPVVSDKRPAKHGDPLSGR